MVNKILAVVSLQKLQYTGDNNAVNWIFKPKLNKIQLFNSSSLTQIKSYISQLRNQCLNFLSGIHLNQFNIFYVPEIRLNSNGIRYDEEGFIFTVKENNQYTIAIYENTLDSRSTVIFVIKNSCYELAIKDIGDYFASPDKVNRREKLSTNYVNANSSGIVRLFREVHNDFDDWKRRIIQLVRNSYC